MHLHSMTVQAIGPFAGRYTIDFEALGASGIFLLEGPTGAGKSTLIDAIVFALYGKVASAEASEDRLRSGHAADDVESIVDLVLETGNGIYRVRRTPQFDRPKKRGEGTVRQPASVKLWRLTSLPGGPLADHDDLDGEIVSTRLDEAGLELRRAIGLDREQFVQTIVLPQGEFASFLRADPEARSGLLQRIFGTQAYEQLQKQLEEMRREAGRALAEARADVGRAAAHFIGAASLTDGVDPEPVAQIRAAAESVSTDLVDLVDAQVARLSLLAERAATDDARARSDHVAARDALAAETGRASALARRDALRSEQVALDARSADHAAAHARLSEARRAATVRPLLDGADRADAAQRDAVSAWRTALRAAPADLVTLLGGDVARNGALPDTALLDTALLDTAPLDRARMRDHGVVATLERVVGLEDGLPTLRSAEDALEAELAGVGRDLAAIDAELLARPEERRLLAERQAEVAAVAVQVGARRDRAATARSLLVHAQDADRTRAELATIGVEHGAAVGAARAALAVETHLRAARIEGMAGELAAGLHLGEPCPVCGAVEHPAPAQVDVDHPDPQQIEDAARARAAADATL
ncbi:MAG: AAA family ATPase, partial [Cellulomonas sp.]